MPSTRLPPSLTVLESPSITSEMAGFLTRLNSAIRLTVSAE